VAVKAEDSAKLMSLFSKTFPKAPKFNRALAKWEARDIIESYGYDATVDAIKWYGNVTSRQDWKHFVRMVDSCVRESQSHSNDVSNRRKLRAIADEWRNS
jgi:hypothetical protein